MLTIHPVRTGDYVILSEQEFSLLVQTLLKTQPVEVIEKYADDIETEEERLMYAEAIEELEQGKTIDFDMVKDFWLRGESADAHLAT